MSTRYRNPSGPACDRSWIRRSPRRVTQEEQIDVGAVVQLPASQLAEGKDRKTGGLGAVLQTRRLLLFRELGPTVREGPGNHTVCQPRQSLDCLLRESSPATSR